MTEDEIIRLVTGLPGVVAETAGKASGAPEAALGDSFFVYDPDSDLATDQRFLPFATIVTKDYPGFDTALKLHGPGVFRLNIAVGRTRFEDLIGYPPAKHEARADDFDYSAADQLLPHPAYGSQAWVSILNPSDRTSDQARSLLLEAHGMAAKVTDLGLTERQSAACAGWRTFKSRRSLASIGPGVIVGVLTTRMLRSVLALALFAMASMAFLLLQAAPAGADNCNQLLKDKGKAAVLTDPSVIVDAALGAANQALGGRQVQPRVTAIWIVRGALWMVEDLVRSPEPPR